MIVKKKILSVAAWILIVAMAAGFASCRELAQDGKLAGQWQVTSIKYADGTEPQPPLQRYYCVYRDVVQLTAPGGTRITGILDYSKGDPTMTFTFPGERPSALKPWGITFPDTIDPDAKGCSVVISIVSLTDSRLVMLTPAGDEIACRKY